MILAPEIEDYKRLWMHYHENIKIILTSEEKSRPCLEKEDCVWYEPTPQGGVPPPTFTHMNIPIWYVGAH